MGKKSKIAVSALAVILAVAMAVLFGCVGGGNGGETTTAGGTTADGTTASETTKTDGTTASDVTTKTDDTTKSEGTTAEGTTAEGTTAEGTTAADGTTKADETTTADETTKEEKKELDPENLTLKTQNATLSMKAENDKITVTSLKTNKGTEYISEDTVLTLPDVGETFTLDSVTEYDGERTTEGLKFTFTSKSFKYEYYVVSSESYSGPFEFYGYLTNTSAKSKKISNGSYFDMSVKFASTPTATTFDKESGVAEGWKIYSGTYYAGTGMYKTKLGTTSENNSGGQSAKFTRSSYTALFFWTGITDTDEHTITFYAKGKKGETIQYGYEAAHATIDGEWQPAVLYDVAGEYTFQKDNEWELVTLKLKSSNVAGTDKEGKVWNTDHANNGFPFYIYTTDATGSTFWIDDVTINGETQSFDGSTPADGWAYGSWVPASNVEIDKTTGYVKDAVTTGYAKAVAEYTTNQNWNAGGDISMMYLDTGSQGMYFAQEWSNGKLTAQGAKGSKVYLNAIIGSGSFSTTLTAGQSMLFPSIYVGVYDGDIEDGSNLYKRWFLHEKAPENMVEDENEPLTQQDMQIGYGVKQYGIQSIKWDYGWWSNDTIDGSSWREHEGMVTVANSAYLSVIGASTKSTESQIAALFKNFVKKANKSGVKLATYVLLKDTETTGIEGVPTSIGEYAHPEWFSDVCITGVGNSADLGNTDCVAFYQEYLYNFFSGNGVTTWRSDFEPICRSSNKANRHSANGTDVQYWCTVGFSELVDYLIDNIDGFRYESCSSGGSMKDLFTATKASVINCDDSADYMSLHMSFYDSSYCFHPAQLQLPINSLTYTQGTTYYTGSADYIYGLRTQLTGAVMLSNWSGTDSVVNETNTWKTVIADTYNNRIKPLIREGDLYHILDRPDGVNWDGLEYVNLDVAKGEDCGVVMLWKPAGADKTKTIKLRGLDENASYTITYTDHTSLNCTKTGKELMNTGLTVVFNSKDQAESDIIFLAKK